MKQLPRLQSFVREAFYKEVAHAHMRVYVSICTAFIFTTDVQQFCVAHSSGII